MFRVGIPGGRVQAEVGERGAVRAGELTLHWWVGAQDRWHDPANEVTVRTRRLEPAPIYETWLRVPGGDAIRRVYGAADAGGVVVVEVENASPAPFVVAFAVRGGRRITCDGSLVTVDDRPVLALPRPPAQSAPAEAPDDAYLLPVAHRTRLRVALTAVAVDVNALPDAADAARGWARLLDRGMRTELPDPMQRLIDRDRVDLLLSDPTPETFALLEAWGFDDEARAVWERLGLWERRRARRRVRGTYLSDVHEMLVSEHKSGVDLLPGFTPTWVGSNIAVHDIPLRAGPLSFAVRWHGERPALLWDAPAGVGLRTPVLDPSWWAPGGAGETLLAAPVFEDVRR
jgi:hypothetical protein